MHCIELEAIEGARLVKYVHRYPHQFVTCSYVPAIFKPAKVAVTYTYMHPQIKHIL